MRRPRVCEQTGDGMATGLRNRWHRLRPQLAGERPPPRLPIGRSAREIANIYIRLGL